MTWETSFDYSSSRQAIVTKHSVGRAILHIGTVRKIPGHSSSQNNSAICLLLACIDTNAYAVSDCPAWLDLSGNPSSHDDRTLEGEATGFSVVSPLIGKTVLDAIESKIVEVVVLLIVLLVREDRPALEVVNAHASHDAPQDPGFKGGETVVCTKDQLCPCYSMFLRRSPWTLPYLWSS